MKTIPFLLFLSLFVQPVLSQTWTTLAVPYSSRYDDLFFLDDSVGWTCNSFGQIYKTIDGGESWEGFRVSAFSYLRSIEFMDADTGFCGGLDASDYFFKSTDGGQTWNNISANVPGLSGGICGLSCPGAKVIYGCGVWSSPAYVIKSSDGGNSWQKIDMSAYASALVDILFINQDTGWVSGRGPLNNGGVVLHTTDGGASWQPVHNTGIPGDYVWKLQRLDEQHWFASIERDPISGAKTNILRSNDGLTWETLLVKNNYYRLQAIGFISPEHGWTGDQLLYETTDSGQTWTQINSISISGDSFNRFFRRNAHAAFLSGSSIYRFDDISTASHEYGNSKDNQVVHRLKISPNPAIGEVEIAVSLGQKTQVILKIYDFNGGYEEVLWTGEQQAGDYLLHVDLTQKPPGVYVVYLKTHHGTQHTLITVLHKK